MWIHEIECPVPLEIRFLVFDFDQKAVVLAYLLISLPNLCVLRANGQLEHNLTVCASLTNVMG